MSAGPTRQQPPTSRAPASTQPSAPAGSRPAVPAQRRAAASGKPVVVYPNSGERWDAPARRWTGSPGLPVDAVRTWLDAGAQLVGGCCRVGPDDVAAVAGAVRGWASPR